MQRQKNNLQVKEKEESPEKELNKTEASILSHLEFKVMVIRMCMELSENYISMKKEIETIYKNQEEMNSKITEIKNALEEITRRLDEIEDRISELEDKIEKKHPEVVTRK